ncbi:MAG: hypothetical protein ACLQAN_07655 [Acidimicrobiales bacterium]
MAFQISPEQPAQVEGQIAQRGVVEHRLAFLQVCDEQVTNWAAGDGVPVDELGRAELANGAECPERRRRLLPEDAHRVEQLVKGHRPVRAERPAVDGE